MTCLECQLAQGCEGDLIVIRGKDQAGKILPATITCETELASDGRTRWKKGGVKTVYSGEQFWWSKHEPGFEEKLDNRGKWDVGQSAGSMDAGRMPLPGRSCDHQDQRCHRQ